MAASLEIKPIRLVHSRRRPIGANLVCERLRVDFSLAPPRSGGRVPSSP